MKFKREMVEDAMKVNEDIQREPLVRRLTDYILCCESIKFKYVERKLGKSRADDRKRITIQFTA